MRRAFLLLLIAVALPALAQPPRPPSPPEPARFDIDIRYRIDAFRTERARQFKEFTAQLKDLGFERDPDDDARGEDNLEFENLKEMRMLGSVPAEAVRRVARLRNVLSVLSKPA